MKALFHANHLIAAACIIAGSIAFGQPDANYESACSNLSREYTNAFAGTKFWGYQPFVSHPNISSNELESIRGFFSLDKTSPEQAQMWFSGQNIPVATRSYGGGTAGSYFVSFMRKIDEDAWLVFSFYDRGVFGLIKPREGVKLRRIYLLRHNKKWRWIEDVLPVAERYDIRRFKDGEPDEKEWLPDEDVRVECDL